MTAFDPQKIERPDPALPKYFAIVPLFTGPGFLVVFRPFFFKYETLRYGGREGAAGRGIATAT